MCKLLLFLSIQHSSFLTLPAKCFILESKRSRNPMFKGLSALVDSRKGTTKESEKKNADRKTPRDANEVPPVDSEDEPHLKVARKESEVPAPDAPVAEIPQVEQKGVPRPKVNRERWTRWEEDVDGAALAQLGQMIEAERRRHASMEGGEAVVTVGQPCTMEGFCLGWIDFLTLIWKHEVSALSPPRDPNNEEDEVDAIAVGRSDTLHPAWEKQKVFVKSVRSLKPLREDLQDCELDTKILESLYHIFRAVEVRHYIKADEAYFNLTIGNDPWHLGVYGGGIHARKSLDRIQRGTIKRLMNNETIRDYMYAVKLLIGVASREFPPESNAL